MIKNSIYKHVDVIDSQSEYVLWLKIRNDYTHIGSDIVIGIVYIPPLHSRFYNDDEYEIFENEVAIKCSSFEHVYICGDMNAQTADLSDYTENDDFLTDFFNLDNETLTFFDQKAQMENCNIPLRRVSQDKKKITMDIAS